MDRDTIIGTPESCIALSADLRRRHIGVIGATGSGKTSLLLNLFAQDCAGGDGVLYIDPLGDDAERALALVPRWRRNQVCYFDMSDREHPIALNILEDVAPRDRELLADNIVTAMRGIWGELSWGPRLEQILRHSLLALIETPNASLLMLPRLLTDDGFRKRVVARLSNPIARNFFLHRFEAWKGTDREAAIDPVLNKAEAFLFSPLVRNSLGQARTRLDLGHEMAHRRIVIANLAKGVLGETSAHLLGALLIARVQAAGAARLTAPSGEERPDFHLIIDEAQDFSTAVLPTLLSQARHYGVTLTIATQYLDALPEKTRAAFLANPATLVAFNVSGVDARLLAPEFDRDQQAFNAHALMSLARGEAMVRTRAGDAHRLELAVPPEGTSDHAEISRRQSRLRYGSKRADIEARIEKLLRF
jgi:hypothetical protein